MILMIDDMAIFREPMAACLRLAGFETECAVDGIDGLGKARQHKPDLILLDMAMPNMDGLTFLRTLRADPQLADIPVIALTAVTDKDYIQNAAELKICEYMLKSRFRTADLVQRISKYLGNHKSGSSGTCPANGTPRSVHQPQSVG